jgi:hypothetical protein
LVARCATIRGLSSIAALNLPAAGAANPESWDVLANGVPGSRSAADGLNGTVAGGLSDRFN